MTPERRGLDLRLLLPAGAAWAVVALVLGMPAARVVVVAVSVTASALLAATALAVVLHRAGVGRVGRQRLVLGQLVLVAVAGTLTAVIGHRLVATTGPIDQLAQRRAIVTVEGSVSSDPRRLTSTTLRGRTLVVIRLLVLRVEGRGAATRVRTPIVVFGDESWLTVRWHERVRVTVRLQAARPGDDAVATASARGQPQVFARAGPVERVAEALRADLRAATDHLPADARGLVPALVIGDTSRLPPDLDDDMRATGMTHLNAVSGSNVTFVLMATGWVAGWLRVPRRARLPASLAVLAAFVFLCRPEPSVIRAAVMGAVGLLGMSASRRSAGPSALAAAILVLLVIDPSLARSFGFALSALATAGLLFFARPWGDALARHLPPRAHPLADAIVIPLAAQAMCAPVIVLLQSSVSLVGLPANVLAAPLVAPATLGGVMTVLLAPFGPSVAWLPSWAAGLPAWGIATIAHVCAAVPWGSLPWPGGAFGALLLAALTLAALLTGPWVAATARRRPWAAVSSVVVAAAVVVPLPGGGWPPADWVIVACDVGQGDGLVLRTAAGRAVVVDTGPDPQAMTGCLDRLKVTSIDAIVLSHFHADHVTGLAGVAAGRPVGELFVTSVSSGADAPSNAESSQSSNSDARTGGSGTSDSGTGGSGSRDEAGRAAEVERVARNYRWRVTPLRQGDLLRWPGVEARVLWPGRTLHAGSVQNNGSVALDVRAGGLRLLLTGDLEREGAAAVLRELQSLGQGSRFDVLKVAHHGSSNQDPDLVRAVGAPVALVSVGAGNDYGHPAARTLALLASAGSAVYRTDRGGDIAVVARGGRAWVARP
ncbi:MBL fold metallo-hydrolase [Calidifontibacter sp. DB0510]|uniref:MBL fold metallo-hydrolase n=1 Tax=Metallococcus carri TaxID=1656884 RepID=A0A967B2I1_9MICO|nr:ComEC/Rec2 family competence protein [Metallococcus carri]NHN56080.1 MBL fold metallo-hydrolase [Metallococcus carri]NOP37463.1 MBL fold metallo-hydrolase [Calidifontibacter sp. DB2511S]